MSVYSRIKKSYDSLSKTEKKVARFCLSHYDNVGKCTISSLSEQTGCGEATIIRFCQKTGYESFHEFRKTLQEEAKETTYEPNSFVTGVKDNIIEMLNSVSRNIDDDQLHKILTTIFKARIVFCAGVGNSGTAAEACASNLLRSGKNGIFLKDSHLQSIYVYELDSRDVAILFSITGETKDMTHLIKLLKKQKVTIVTITSNVVSSMAKMSDFILLTKQTSGPLAAGSMLGQISQMYIVDILTSGVDMLDPKKALKAKEMTFDFILDKFNIDGSDI